MGLLSILMASILSGTLQTVLVTHPQLNTQEVFLLLNQVGLSDVGLEPVSAALIR